MEPINYFEIAKLAAQPPDYEKKLSQLARIRHMLDMRSKGSPSPRFISAGLTAIGVFITALVVLSVAPATLPISSTKNFSFLLYPLFFCTFFVKWHFTSGPKTYTDKMYGMLGKYDPVDPVAYAALQKETLHSKCLDADVLEEWLRREGDAISKITRQNKRLPESANNFLSKKV